MITFYTNKGKTIDQYSMEVRTGMHYDCYSFSDNAMSPQGVNQFNGTYADVAHDDDDDDDDDQIDFDDLPSEVRQAVVKRLYVA